MPTKSIIEEAVTRMAEKKADAFFEQFDTIKAHLQKVWDAEKPKFDSAVENDEGNGTYRFFLDLSELGSIDKTQAEAVFQTLPAFEPISHWIDVKDAKDEANPQKFEVAIQFEYQRERAIKDVMNRRIEKRRREEKEAEREAEREAETKKARTEADTDLNMCETLVGDTPTSAGGILESALAGLGYGVDPDSGVTLGGAWKRALLNEANKEASKAFRQALLDVVKQCPDQTPFVMKHLRAAKARVAERRGLEPAKAADA